jgi:hypothetical protein
LFDLRRVTGRASERKVTSVSAVTDHQRPSRYGHVGASPFQNEII